MARIVTKELALKIAKKLEAELSEITGGHTKASIFYEGKLIASFGIRRGSEKDKGHDFIQRQLYIGPHDAKLLAQCPLTRDGWIKKIRDKGKI
jgi:hypothetical protein